MTFVVIVGQTADSDTDAVSSAQVAFPDFTISKAAVSHTTHLSVVVMAAAAALVLGAFVFFYVLSFLAETTRESIRAAIRNRSPPSLAERLRAFIPATTPPMNARA